jgi:hypothetical protein
MALRLGRDGYTLVIKVVELLTRTVCHALVRIGTGCIEEALVIEIIEMLAIGFTHEGISVGHCLGE